MFPTARKRTLGFLVFATAFGVVSGCSSTPWDDAADLRARLTERLGEQAPSIEIPFALPPETASLLPAPRGNDLERAQAIESFVFRQLALRYSLTPTRNAAQTLATKEGNCLSFANLFVALARQQGLNAFFVEVPGHRRWSRKESLMLSQGHIVAGLYDSGELRIFDFLPYRPKSYQRFVPIDDLTAIGHHYNNLGAEALLAGQVQKAVGLFEIARRVAPDFVEALSNLGVAFAREGFFERAAQTYSRGLALDADNVALLSNLARLRQLQGLESEATALRRRIGQLHHQSPFHFVQLAEQALSDGNAASALEHLRLALRIDSEVPEAHVGLAKTYLALGDMPAARHHVQRALTLDPTHPSARRTADLLETKP